MASTIFHHWFDRFRALPKARRTGLAVAAVGVVALGVFALGAGFGRGLGFPGGLEARAQHLAARNTALNNENQGLRQQQQTDRTTVAALQQALASRDAEMQKLRRAQVFYAKLIGIDSRRSGLGVHGVELARVGHTDAWNFTVTLVNTAKNADASRGVLTLQVEGVRDGKLATLDWHQLAGGASANGLPFAFKFFQQVQGSLALPQGFVPNRVTVSLAPRGGSRVVHAFAWNAALVSARDVAIGPP